VDAARAIVGVLAIIGIAAVLASVLRTLVVPRAFPAGLARFAFLGVRMLLLFRLWLTRRTDSHTRDRIFGRTGSSTSANRT
jgi:hypothetical protein